MELRCKNTDFSETTNIFMKKNTDFSARLKDVIDFLKVTPNTFGQILGYNRSQTIYDLINDRCKPSYDFVKKLMDSEYSETISVDWLITGRGEMLRSNLPVAQPTTEPGTGIPLIPLNAMAGAFAGEQVVLELECERYVVPAFKDAEFLITVKGLHDTQVQQRGHCGLQAYAVGHLLPVEQSICIGHRTRPAYQAREERILGRHAHHLQRQPQL